MDRIVKLSPEEISTVSQVRRKNFYYYIVPMTIGSVYLCRHLMASGRISASYGLAKLAGATGIAFIVGKSLLPGQIIKALYTQYPEGEFVKTRKYLMTLSPEDRKDYLQNAVKQNAPILPETSGQRFPVEPVQTSEVAPVQTSEGDKPSFSYAQQRQKWKNSGTSYGQTNQQCPISQSGKDLPESSSEPITSSPQPLQAIYGDNKPSIPTSLPDKPIPVDSPSSSSYGKKVRKNQYGDDME